MGRFDVSGREKRVLEGEKREWLLTDLLYTFVLVLLYVL